LKSAVGAATLPFVIGFEKASNPAPTLRDGQRRLRLERYAKLSLL